MENNSCETNHLDSNVLLPPRKRLLAGLKKQNSDANSYHPSVSSEIDNFETHMNSLMNFHLGNPNLSLEEAVEASRIAATSALELAVRARAVAFEKEEIAAKAMAAAKRALDLVASISEDEENKERYLKKNRMKKHLPFQTLYNKKQFDNSKSDEEVARNLHRAMNSSLRISKSSPGPKICKNKKVKLNGNNVRVDESTSRFEKSKVVENGEEAGTSRLEENKLELLYGADNSSIVKGRMKQKKLPLSIFSSKGRLNSESSPSSMESEKIVSNNLPNSSLGPIIDGVEKTPMWKCKALKAITSIKNNESVKS